MLTGWPNRVTEQLKPYYHCRNELIVEDSCLLWGNRMIINFSFQNTILDELHDNHPDITCMKSLATSYIWWPPMDTITKQKVKSCNLCEQRE